MQYKVAKTAFTILLRKYQKEQRDSYNELDLKCRDPSKLFRLIRRVNGIASEPTCVLKVGGTIYKGGEIPDAWATSKILPPHVTTISMNASNTTSVNNTL